MKGRILVVDDNVNLTTLLAKTLGKFDYEVVAENDSCFALDTTRRVRPNLILLDVMMPNRDGGQVLRELRNDAQLRPIPVILLTALAREAQGLADQGGIQSVVMGKPIELKALVEEIDRHLNATMSFRETMTHHVREKSGLPVETRRGNAFGGPPPSELRQNQGQAFREIAPTADSRPKPVIRPMLGQRLRKDGEIELPS